MCVHLPVSLACKLAAVLLFAGLVSGFCLASAWQAPTATASGSPGMAVGHAAR
ncbi:MULTISPECIES: hypothetical protein [unclassified Amycolatopsis]|uniref:hypothetical protein n=1 Tax=unclassified Amycolatopsis TaxID=2618356 RepID=UPI001FF26E1F|nr:hypothetical protein [Amycolatopsis sp. FBCC-B4732]UOX84461.1 hypothetical protein MUY14_21780 [Amycolatopsis sp. FBCC-B4732]